MVLKKKSTASRGPAFFGLKADFSCPLQKFLVKGRLFLAQIARNQK
jgi:hypothetical protein